MGAITPATLVHHDAPLIVFSRDDGDVEIPELGRLARTIDGWRDEIRSFGTTGGASSRPTEAVTR